MLAALPDNLALLDASGTIVAVNEAWERFGRESAPKNKSLPGRLEVGTNYLAVCRTAADDPIARQVLNGLEAILAGMRMCFAVEYPCHATSQRRWFLLRAMPAPGGHMGVLLVRTDITARKLVEEKQARLTHALERDVTIARGEAGTLRTALECAPDGTLVADRDGCIQFVNRQVEALFGYSRQELLGQPVELLIPERFHAIHQQHREEYIAAPATRTMGPTIRLFGRRHDGSEFPVEITLAPLEAADSKWQIIVSIRDVSELQRAQAANRELRQLLAVTDTTLSHLELNDLLPELLDRVRNEMEVDIVTVLLLFPDGKELWVRATSGMRDDVVAVGARVPMGEGVAGRIAASRLPLVVDDLSTFPVGSALAGQGICSVVGVPLLLRDRILGVLQVGTTRLRHFTEQDVQLLQRVAERLSLAIERVQHFQAERRTRQVAWGAISRAHTSETRLKRLSDAGIIGIVVDDGERVVEANDAFLKMVGYTREQVRAGTLTLQVLAASDPELLAAWERDARQALRTGICEPCEHEYVRRDGSRVPVLIGVALLQRTPPLFMSFVVDLSERKQLERTAEKHAAQLAAVFHAISDGIVVFDLAGNAILINEAEARINGFARPEQMQQNLAYFADLYELSELDGRVLRVEEWPVSRALRGESLADWVLRGRRRDTGQEWVFSFSAEPIRNAQGDQILAVVVTHDFSERMRLEQSLLEREQLNRATFEQAAVGMARLAPDGGWLDVNERLCEIVGYSREELLKRTFQDITYTDDLPIDLENVGRAFAGELDSYAREKRYVRKDGTLVWVHLTVSVVRGAAGNPQCLIVVVEDISSRKQAEAERQRLEREREEARASELAAREVAQHLDEFFKTASHDIRSPVGVVLGQLQVALRRLERLQETAHEIDSTGRLDERLAAVHDSMAEADASADALARLVVRLFDVARARAGVLELELAQSDLAALVGEQVAAYRMMAPDRTIHLDLPDQPVMVVADADRLAQVLANFLTNALKYSPKETPVMVGVVVAKGRATVSVRDEGPGLSSEEQRRVWEPFHRAPGVEVQSRTGPAAESLGLGLHICRGIVEQHPGGQVGIKSVSGHGATFWFSLPLARPADVAGSGTCRA